jgi:hypothetical protein
MHKNNLHKIYGMIKYNTNKSNYFDNLKGWQNELNQGR